MDMSSRSVRMSLDSFFFMVFCLAEELPDLLLLGSVAVYGVLLLFIEVYRASDHSSLLPGWKKGSKKSLSDFNPRVRSHVQLPRDQ